MSNPTITAPPAAPAPQPAPRTNTLAILALVFAFLFWPLSIVFGHVARKQIKRTGEDGGGLALAGLTISYIGLGFFVLLMVIGGIAAASNPAPVSGGQFSGLSPSSAASDVQVTQCGVGELGMADVAVKVTNTTDRVQSYLVTASVNDKAGNRLGEANGAVNALSPGQSANAQLVGSVSGPVVACTVANVTRFAS